MMKRMIFVLTAVLLAACRVEETAVSPPPTPIATATATATLAPITATEPPPSAPTAIPTTVPATATLVPTVTPETAVYGRDASGAFFYGNPNADVVLIDFSDFM